MLRIGKLTHRIYEEGYDLSKIGECCVCCREEEKEQTLDRIKARDD